MVHKPSDEIKCVQENADLTQKNHELTVRVAKLADELGVETEVRRRNETDLYRERNRAEMLQTEKDHEWLPRHVPVDDYRGHDRLGRLAPRNPFGDPILLFRTFSGLADGFQRIVPPLDASTGHGASENAVACLCGHETILVASKIVECSGECGRWFLQDRDQIRCANLGRHDATE